ncbi:zinc finger protein 251-like [Gopherus flavomarginatus]|uniref:zinc finger protein 251-like n=1 Tax=Gopherus flavomarginatus TaxID=286002 RepID=UPI0021CC306F|nr:zinc finger protein 251-like [Gopherus flavomarginatus]
MIPRGFSTEDEAFLMERLLLDSPSHKGPEPVETQETLLERSNDNISQTSDWEKPCNSECKSESERKTPAWKSQGKRLGTWSECGENISQSSELIQHQRTHMGERAVKYTECGKNFQENSPLTSHQRLHREETPSRAPSGFHTPAHINLHKHTDLVQVAETFYIKDKGTLCDEEKRSVWRDIMQEACDTKLLLGFMISKPDVISQVEQGEKSGALTHQVSKKREIFRGNCTADDRSITEEATPQQEDPEKTEPHWTLAGRLAGDIAQNPECGKISERQGRLERKEGNSVGKNQGKSVHHERGLW